jgi:pimeloyl-ACP methyl ester carboxylesterase
MPQLKLNGVELAYEIQGRGFPILFSHALLFDHRMYLSQINELSKQFQTIAIDTHGHGASTAPLAEITLDQIADDFIKAMDYFGYARYLFVGLSMGGMIGLRIALKAPHRLKGLVLIDTSGNLEDPGKKYQYDALIQTAEEIGITPELADMVLPFMFSEKFLREQPQLVKESKETLSKQNVPGVLRVSRAVIDRPSILDQIGKISLPTLILVGNQDTTQPLDESEKIHTRIAHSKLVPIPDAGHISSIEQPELVTRHILQFAQELGIH